MPTIKQITEAFVYWRMIEYPELQKLGSIDAVVATLLNTEGGSSEASSIIIRNVMRAHDWLAERGLLPEDE